MTNTLQNTNDTQAGFKFSFRQAKSSSGAVVLNKGYISPLPGKKFSQDELDAILARLNENSNIRSAKHKSYNIEVERNMQGNYRYSFRDLIEHILPRAETKLDIKREKTKLEYKKHEREEVLNREKHRQDNPQEYSFIERYFPNLNEYIAHNLARVLTKEGKNSDVLVSHLFTDGLKELGLVNDNLESINKLKEIVGDKERKGTDIIQAIYEVYHLQKTK